MNQNYQQHPLPSHGRVDYPDGPTPFTVTGPRPADQSGQADQPRPDTLAQQMWRGITHVNRALAEHRAASFDPNLTQQAQRNKLADFGESDYAKALPVYDQVADQLVAEKQAAYDEQFKSLTPVGDTAAELRAQRTWTREQAKLDALASEGERANAVRSTIERCDDPATLAVLIEEVPSYLESKGVDTSWIPAVVAEKVPALAEAKTTLHNAEQVATAIHHASGMMRKAIASGNPLVALDKIAPVIDRHDPDR